MRAAFGVAIAVAVFAAARSADAHEGAEAEAQRWTREIAAAGGDVAGATWLARAAAFRDEGELDAAEADLRAAERAQRPAEPAQVALERARLAVARGADERAIADYDATLRLERPEGRAAPSLAFAAALAERAATNELLGRWDRARADWDGAFHARPTADAALARGALDETSGELDRAVDGYREALAMTPAIAIARALARALLARGDANEVVALADEALEQAPLRAEWLLLRAQALDDIGAAEEATADRREALDEAERAVSARPTALRRLLRARVWLATGRRDEAAREAEAILAAHPALLEAAQLVRDARATEAPR